VPIPDQIPTSQSMLLQVKYISILDHTSNSGPVAPIAISYCHCWCYWPRCAKWRTARPNLLELVEDTDLLRGRSVAGCCALGAQRSWLVGILWCEGKSGHLDRAEMIGSVQEVLGWLYSWTTERWQRRRNRRVHVVFSLAEPELALASRATPCYAILFPPPDALSVKNASTSMQAPLAQRDLPQLQGPDTVNPTLLHQNMPIHPRR
jgi:hypothetical protein